MSHLSGDHKISVYHAFSDVTGKEEYCDEDGNILDNFRFDPNLHRSYFISDGLSIEQYFKNKQKARDDLEAIILRVKQGEEWEDFDESTPESITYEIKYPGSKADEIDMSIAKTYGEITQIGLMEYSVNMPTSAKEAIVLSEYTYGSPRRNEKIVFLGDYNLFYKLRFLCDDFMYAGNSQDDPLRDEGRQIALTYIKHIRAERRELYSALVAKGDACGKWKSELIAFTIIKSLYPDAIYQYRDEWLGRQSVDVYLPQQKIAFEYQGLQHYEPVDYFGGESVFKATVERDQIKRDKCMQHGVRLIEWPYHKPLTRANIQAEIMKVLLDI